MIHVVVAYAKPDSQIELPIAVAPNASVAMAIRRSGILEQFPELSLADLQVGIHSKKVAIDAPVQDGDRIEIYRPLTIDPNSARLLRAKKKK